MPSLEDRLPSLRRAIIELVDAFIESLEDASVRTVVREQIHLLDKFEQLDRVIEIVDDIAVHVRENNDTIIKMGKQITNLQKQVAVLKRQAKKSAEA